jgi:hypothetical protein
VDDAVGVSDGALPWHGGGSTAVSLTAPGEPAAGVINAVINHAAVARYMGRSLVGANLLGALMASSPTMLLLVIRTIDPANATFR